MSQGICIGEASPAGYTHRKVA